VLLFGMRQPVMNHRHFWLPLCCALLAGAAGAQVTKASLARVWVHHDLASSAINAPIQLAPRASGPQVTAWEMAFVKTETRYVRFVLEDIQVPPDAELALEFVSDTAGVVAERYTARQLSGMRQLVTGLLPPGSLRIRVLLQSLATPASMRLAKIEWRAGSTATTPQSAMQQGDPVTTLPAQHPMRRVAESVAMLHVGPLGSTCTAFIVDKDVLATNFHCMETSLRFLETAASATKLCGDIIAEFDYLRPGAIGKQAPCMEVSKVSEERDLVLLKIPVPPAASGSARAVIKISPDDPAGSRLQILHHPMGRPMVHEEGCKYRGQDAADLLHDCGTRPGSSGSVVLSEKGELVGVHYKGAFGQNITPAEQDKLYELYGELYNRAKPAALLSNIP
jgi:hypothetical protein